MLSRAVATENGVCRFATFYVGDMFFGIEVRRVQELLRRQEITRVPLAPDVIQGVINLRGQIVTAVDMRRCLGLSPVDSDQSPMNVVVRSGDGTVSLIVDGIDDVIEPDPDCGEPPPATMPAEQREIIERVYKLEGKLLLALNVERLLQNLGAAVAQPGGETA